MPAPKLRGWPRWRVRAGYPAALLYLWLAHPAPLALAAGGVVAFLGLLVRGFAAGHLKKQQELATAGPYAWTRNPLYFGSAAIAPGLLIAAKSWIAAGVVVAYFLVFYPAVIRREAEELAARYGAAYEEYARQVPLFFPRRPRPVPYGMGPRHPAGAARFSWELYLRNHEYRAALGFVAALLLLLAKMFLPGLAALAPR
jgi:Phospholipid methyltransferase